MEKKKLCLVIPSLQAGGMERVMSELAGYFASREELEVHLILYGISREIFYEIPDNILISIPGFKFHNKWRLWYTIKTIYFLRVTIKNIRPDSILSFGEYWNSFVLLAVRFLNYPVFISDRCSPVKEFGLFHGLLRKFLYTKASGIIAQTETAKQFYSRQIAHHNITVISNPVRNNTSYRSFKERENIILSVGRLIETKHYDRLIKIFHKTKAPGWKLVIIGSNALKQDNMTKLLSLVNELELKSCVVIEGKKSNVFDYYNKSKIFAFTSSSEGFPNVIGEALAAGVPAISYNCIAGPSDLISDGINGFLVPVFNDELFLEKLQLLVDDETLLTQMSKEARNSVTKLSTANIGDKYYSFITSKS